MVKYQGRLGNQLLQYSFGRILAEHLGTNLIADPIPGFINTGEKVEGRVLNGHILIDGTFQRYENFKAHKAKIRHWLWVEPMKEIEEDVVAVHVRAGDYRTWIGGQGLCPVEYYDTAIERIGPGKIHVLTDDPNDPLPRSVIARHNGTLVHRSLLDDYRYIHSARRIVLSASTFSWIAAWLSEAQKIVLPLVGHFHPKQYTAYNMVVDDDERYINLEYESTVAMTYVPFEERKKIMAERLRAAKKARLQTARPR